MNTFHIAFDGRDRRFQVMGNVTDELFVFFVIGFFLCVGIPQTLAHLLKIPDKAH